MASKFAGLSQVVDNPKRRQNASPTFRLQSVTFQSRKNDLSGILVLPHGSGPHPAIVFILGSGPVDHKYFGIAARLWTNFAQLGFASLVWDRPGVGGSTGDYNEQSFEDRAEEVLAAVRFLKSRPEIKTNLVGVWGHSQGGMVAPLAAALSDQINFLIEVSGWQGKAWRQDEVRVAAEMDKDGQSQLDIQAAVAFARSRMGFIRSVTPFEEFEKVQQRTKGQPWFKYVHYCDRALFRSARMTVEYDTQQVWERVRCPVLAIYGDADTSSGKPAPLIEIIRAGLAKAGNTNFLFKIIPNADHSLFETRQHGVASRAFAPGYLETLTSWLEPLSRKQ